MASFGTRLSVFISAAVLVVGALGCSSEGRWKPGEPDALTADHYAAAQTAIEAKNKHDAQAALYLLRSDVTRMSTDSATMQVALANVYGVTDAVNKEDWDKAHSRLLALKPIYGRK